MLRNNKNDNLLYGLRLTEINFINEEISAQQLHIISIFECKINTGNAS